jgi:catechol 2,3-dioxygenase-like lactoylglutathione lyase family enzyme
MTTRLDLVTLVVDDYDAAIEFFVRTLGFDLVEDSPATTESGTQKRWVVVRPPDAETGLLLARADSKSQGAVVGNQAGGRVAFFLRVENFEDEYRRLVGAGVDFVREPKTETYGRVAVFLDCVGNRWDLLGRA